MILLNNNNNKSSNVTIEVVHLMFVLITYINLMDCTKVNYTTCLSLILNYIIKNLSQKRCFLFIWKKLNWKIIILN